MTENSFDFLRRNHRSTKPRHAGVTEIRGPYYSLAGPSYLEDLFGGFGEYVDILKFAGGSFTLMPDTALRQLIQVCHDHEVKVSTGGFLEYVLTQGEDAVQRYLQTCNEVGFDIVEISSGFITLPIDDIVSLTGAVQQAGLLAKPEIGIQFGAGGASAVEELEAEGLGDVARAAEIAQRCLQAGAYMIMVESEGITENVRRWRMDIVDDLVSRIGTDRVMFEAADPGVFAWYVQRYGPEVNLFVDHSQIVQLECLRSGIWGTAGLFGRVLTYRPDANGHPTQEATADARRPVEQTVR
ncbi:MAG: phosphosulfolactate synthase [Candidatus Dormibacteraceae bacterium]